MWQEVEEQRAPSAALLGRTVRDFVYAFVLRMMGEELKREREIRSKKSSQPEAGGERGVGYVLRAAKKCFWRTSVETGEESENDFRS